MPGLAGPAKEGKVELGSEGSGGQLPNASSQSGPREGPPARPLRREHPGPSGPGVQPTQMPARNRLRGSQGVNNRGESPCKPHSMEISPTATAQNATKIFILSSSFQNCSLEGNTVCPTSQAVQRRGAHPALPPLKPRTH